MTQENVKHFVNNKSSVRHNNTKKERVYFIKYNSIQGLCYANPHLNGYLNKKKLAKQQVTLVTGGGSGHSPDSEGFVGEGMLSAAVCGHVFASPSASQVLSAIEKVQSPHGTLVIVKNYTGDCLHFGLAVEQAKAKGIKVDMLIVGDDVAIGKQKNNKVGRRGMAAVAIVTKICGALAAQGASLEKIKQVGNEIVQNSVTLGVALNHCHVPGTNTTSQQQQQGLSPSEMELGIGIHNEPGLEKLNSMTIKPLVAHMLELLVNPKDKDHQYLSFNHNHEEKESVILLVNNYGGTSSLELNVIVKETVDYICTKLPYLQLERVLSGSFVTSLNMLGFSLSLIRVVKKEDHIDDDEVDILKLLDYPVQVPGWSSIFTASFSPHITEKEEIDETTIQDTLLIKDHHEDNVVFRNVIHNVIQKILNQSFLDTVTEYDTILGDGDFGQTLKTAGEAIQQGLNNYPFYSYSKTILALAETIDHSVGGTAAAIFCIYLNALATGLNKYDDSSSISPSTSLSIWAKASLYALNSLQTYTLARQGDRTMMDTLIPFVDTFQKEPHSFIHAIEAAHQGMLSTKTQIAKLGRSSYLSNDDVQNANIPDPGAYGLDIILQVIKDSLA
ncbi:unnamed protein product [Cunninghamella echinulata]